MNQSSKGKQENRSSSLNGGELLFCIKVLLGFIIKSTEYPE